MNKRAMPWLFPKHLYRYWKLSSSAEDKWAYTVAPVHYYAEYECQTLNEYHTLADPHPSLEDRVTTLEQIIDELRRGLAAFSDQEWRHKLPHGKKPK